MNAHLRLDMFVRYKYYELSYVSCKNDLLCRGTLYDLIVVVSRNNPQLTLIVSLSLRFLAAAAVVVATATAVAVGCWLRR